MSQFRTRNATDSAPGCPTHHRSGPNDPARKPVSNATSLFRRAERRSVCRTRERVPHAKIHPGWFPASRKRLGGDMSSLPSSTSADHPRLSPHAGNLMSQRSQPRNDPCHTGHVATVLGTKAGTVSASDMSRPSIRSDWGPSGVDARRSRGTAAHRRAAAVELQRLAQYLTDHVVRRAQINGANSPTY